MPRGRDLASNIALGGAGYGAAGDVVLHRADDGTRGAGRAAALPAPRTGRGAGGRLSSRADDRREIGALAVALCGMVLTVAPALRADAGSASAVGHRTRRRRRGDLRGLHRHRDAPHGTGRAARDVDGRRGKRCCRVRDRHCVGARSSRTRPRAGRQSPPSHWFRRSPRSRCSSPDSRASAPRRHRRCPRSSRSSRCCLPRSCSANASRWSKRSAAR